MRRIAFIPLVILDDQRRCAAWGHKLIEDTIAFHTIHQIAQETFGDDMALGRKSINHAEIGQHINKPRDTASSMVD